MVRAAAADPDVESGSAPRALEVSRHREGCPGERIERTESVRPRDRRIIEVVRCIDCGEQDSRVTDRRVDPNGEE